MNPAFSVIFFTTLTGAGYGMLFGLGMYQTRDFPLHREAALETLFAALALVTIGLAISTLHLGKPWRAWRAFSQWRTSWLSREGVFATITYAPALLFGWYIWRGESGFVVTVVALALALCSLLTISCTAMIYTSLKPIPAWNHSLVYPIYLVFALLTGGLWFDCCAGLVSLYGLAVWAAMGLLLAFFKQSYWRDIDRIELPSRESATALEGIGKVTVFERPHTEANYLTREMGFVLARKHSRKLRVISVLLFAGVPLLALLAAWLLPVAAVFALWIAALSALLGALVERWLFFAEAKHMVMLYY